MKKDEMIDITMDTVGELKRCPFCGGKPYYDYAVTCSECGATAKTKDDWNKRVPYEKTIKEMRRMKNYRMGKAGDNYQKNIIRFDFNAASDIVKKIMGV